LPDAGQVSSARDLAILSRSLVRDFPEYDLYWHISSIKFGKRIFRNLNKLIDRYPGADGMKTGYTCASGFNLIASATRDGRRLIAVVLGAPSSPVRAEKAARLLESGFGNTGTLSWLTPSLGTIDQLQPISASPPNLYDETCGPHRRRPAAESEEEDANSGETQEGSNGIAISSLQAPKAASLIGPLIPSMPPIVVSIIPPNAKTAAVPLPAGEAPTAKAEQIAPRPIANVAPVLAGAGGIRSATFSSMTLASNPPEAFAPRRFNITVPVPRPRPHLRLKKHQ
jgi:D-alanyl-D-alanine carboxypeptidase